MATRKNSLYVFVMQLQTVSCTKRKCYRYSVNFQSATPAPPPPPLKKKIVASEHHIVFPRLAKRFSKVL